jgi:hypothetical protein
LSPEFNGENSYCSSKYIGRNVNSFKIINNCDDCELSVVSFAIFSACNCEFTSSNRNYEKYNTLMDN